VQEAEARRGGGEQRNPGVGVEHHRGALRLGCGARGAAADARHVGAAPPRERQRGVLLIAARVLLNERLVAFVGALRRQTVRNEERQREDRAYGTLSMARAYEARQSFASSIATIGLPKDSVRSVLS